jgi:transcription antitermination factor NusG
MWASFLGGVGGGKFSSARAGDKVDVDVGVFEEKKGNVDAIDNKMDVC